MRSVLFILAVTLFSSAATQAVGPVSRSWVNRFAPEPEKLSKLPEYFNDLDKMKSLVAHGLSRQALAVFQAAAKIDEKASLLLRARATASLGFADKALELLQDEKLSALDSAIVLRAEIVGEQGQFDEAVRILDQFVQAHPDSAIARSKLGFALLDAGNVTRAKDEFAWFADKNQGFLGKIESMDDRTFESAEQAVAVGRALDKWATFSGAYRNNARLNNLILNVFVKTYDVVDREYQPARLAAAEYLFAHGNAEEGAEDVSAALEFNPYDRSALTLLGIQSASPGDLNASDAIVKKLRETDPQSVIADIISSWALLLHHRPEESKEIITRALSRQPKNLDALNILAAVEAVRGDEAKLKEVLDRIEAISPNSGEAYHWMADALASQSKFARAISYLQTAVQREPWQIHARNRLGVYLMQEAREDEARSTLEAAHEIDPFNIFTVNSLRLLDQMLLFARIETPHFIMLCDKKDELLVRDVFSVYMEKAYSEVTGDFRWEPPEKTIIEIFPTREQFAVRTTGLPGFDNFGVSKGRLIISIMPGRDKSKGAFQWARVLKHEFTHTVNLLQTNHNIPRWLTEGLAVWEERVEYRFRWVPPVFYKHIVKDQAISVAKLRRDNFQQGSPTGGEMMYMGGFWVTRYIDETMGRDALLRLINAYTNNIDDDAAFKMALGKDVKEFDKGFLEWAKDQVKDWGYDEATEKKVKQMVDRAEGLTAGKKYEQAVEVWTQIGKLQPKNPMVHTRLAGLFLVLKEPQMVVEHLKALLPLELLDARYPRRIARIYAQEGDIDNAIVYGVQATGVNPFDIEAHKLLAELYDKKSDSASAQKHRDIIDILNQQERDAKEKAEAEKQN